MYSNKFEELKTGVALNFYYARNGIPMSGAKNSQPSISEEIHKAYVDWSSGVSYIIPVFKRLNTHHNAVILNEQHIMYNSLSEVKKKAMALFSHDLNMKSFIQDSVSIYRKMNNSSTCGYWHAQKVGQNKLILANFAKIPNNNMFMNKYTYSFNYFEIEVRSKI